jgi:glycosyltransferase involved in cell wall biosynthesis
LGNVVQQSSLTVGLPVYNAMPFLPEAMESLFRQTESDFNILVIVDGGDDESLEYLKAIQDKRLRVLCQQNQGLTATLNRMLRETTTEWLIRQDADDISYPTRIERIRESIAKYPDAGMFYSLAKYHPTKHSLGFFRCSRGSPQELRQIVKSGYLLSICHPSVTLNVEKTLAVGGYRDLPHAEDADLWWRMALHCDIQLLPEALIGFRQNLSSVSSQNSHTQELQGLYIQYLLLSHLSNQNALPLAKILPILETNISSGRLDAKQHLRSLNMHLAARCYGSAVAALARCVLASPTYLLQRLIDEIHPLKPIMNGISPDLFYRRKEVFWP